MTTETEARLYNHAHELLTAHETLLRDAARNRAFHRALKHTVKPGMSVLDIGAGTGIWAIAAAKLGAARVAAIEAEPLLVGMIKKLADENGVADRVEVIQGHSTQIGLSNEFDLIVTETIGHIGFEEQIVPTVIDAKKRFLKPGGRLIPESLALMAAAGHLKSHHKKLPAGVPLEYGAFESLALHAPAGWNKNRLKLMTDPKELVRVDLTTIESPPNLTKLTVMWTLPDAKQGSRGAREREGERVFNPKSEIRNPKSEGRINCFAVWVEARLTAGVKLSTLRTTSWSPVVYRIKPFNEDRGELQFRLTLTDTTNFWTAILSSDHGEEVQKYSPAHAANTLTAAAWAHVRSSRQPGTAATGGSHFMK
jgi:protein arginine N-methyltransferase 1